MSRGRVASSRFVSATSSAEVAVCCEEDECRRCLEWFAACVLIEKLVGRLCPKCAKKYEELILVNSRGTTFGRLVPLYKLKSEDTMQTRMIAEIAYNAYAKMVENKNVRGDELPLFQDLGEKIQNAWIAAVSAVRMP